MNSLSDIRDRPLNFAHRGFTRTAPENTLAAFREAVELGVDGIELDVRACKSGEVVVFHDPTVTRLTTGRGFVKNKTLSELKELRFQTEHEVYRNERIPTLEEVIDTVGETVLLNVEIKTNGLPKNNFEKRIVEILHSKNMVEKSIVSSFNPLVIRRIRKIDDTILTGYLIDKNFNVRRTEIFLTKMSGARAVHIDKSLATESLVKKIQEFGFLCVVWTVNEPELMRRLSDLGVTAIITDRPDQLKNLEMHTADE